MELLSGESCSQIIVESSVQTLSLAMKKSEESSSSRKNHLKAKKKKYLTGTNVSVSEQQSNQDEID